MITLPDNYLDARRARNYLGRKRNLTGQSFWARGYAVSTVGIDEEFIRNYVKNQEREDRQLDDQLKLFEDDEDDREE